MAFAGLWESFRWPDETVLRTFTINTTMPNTETSELHNRMPVILDEQAGLADMARRDRRRLFGVVASCSRRTAACLAGRSTGWFIAQQRTGAIGDHCRVAASADVASMWPGFY
jgi:SOS response associated peptidase (SRAP)